jgi:hypothetical protein
VVVTGIHGEAGNGKMALFGSSNGVIVVNQDGTAKLIPYAAPLTSTSGNWLGTLVGNKKTPFFYGSAGKLGIFKVDVAKNEVSPVFEAANVASIKVSDDGTNLIALLNDGSLKVFNTTTNKETATYQGNLPVTTTGAVEGSIRPAIQVTSKHVLRSNPKTGEVEAFDLNTLTSKYKFNVGGQPFSMTLAGSL